MSYLTKPSNIRTSDMADHKSRGTSGEDYGSNDGSTSYGDKFSYPCSNVDLIHTQWYSSGTLYKEFYHLTASNGFKFSALTCHAKGFSAYNDGYPESTGPHLHVQWFIGHQTADWMQTNRNTHSVTFEELDKQAQAIGGTVEYKYYFKMKEDFDETTRYRTRYGQYRMECVNPTGVYKDANLTKKWDTRDFKPGDIAISNFHSTRIINGKKHWIEVNADNQYGNKIYFAYKREL